MTTTWTTAKLSDIAKIQTGGTPSRADPLNWAQGSIPWITTSEVNGGRIREANQHITAKGLATSSARIVPAGAVLVAMIGQGRTRGQAALLELPAATNQNSAALIPGAKIESEFLHQYLKFRYVTVRALSNSSGQGNLNASLIGGFHVPVPPLPEQRKIAEILRTWDDAIECAETLVHAETQSVGALRRRFFVSCGHEVPLSEVSTRIMRKSDGSSHTVMAISAKTGFVAQADKYRRDMAGASLTNYTLLRRGEFAYNKGNSLTYPQGCIYALKADSALVPNVYYSFRLRGDLNSSYYEHFFASGALNRQLAQRITSGVRGNGLLNLNADDFFGVKVPVPNRATQDGAADTLNMGARKIELLQHKAELLRTQKRGLMQKLLTGQLRVNVAAEIEPGRPDAD